MLPVILGGVALFGAGFIAKKIYDENQAEIDGKIEEKKPEYKSKTLAFL